MAINSEHPYFEEFKEDWIAMRDLYRGERVVKRRNVHYLPATSGMYLDGMGHDNQHKAKLGQAAYDAYLKRAYFYDCVKEGVEGLIGMMHQKPATFELPPQLEPLIEKCTLQGEGLQDLLRRINTEQLITGRIGLLADLPAAQDAKPTLTAPGGAADTPPPAFTGTAETASIVPYIAWYIAEAIINWDEGDQQEAYRSLNLVVLNESGFVRQDDFTWKEIMKYRVLTLGTTLADEQFGTYQMGVFANTQGANNLVFNSDAMKTPILRGAMLDSIPFVFINTKDIVTVPDEPPLLGLGKLALALYRGDADYRQTLFMSGQDTLVVVGGVRSPTGDGTVSDEPLRTGAGARIDVEVGGDAKYIGITATGIAEMRQCITNDRLEAGSKAGRLTQANAGKPDESGEALKTRQSAQTASLTQIAIVGAKGLENLLKKMGEWMGMSQDVIDKIKVIPNLEFADFALVAADIVQLMTAKSMGAPLSKESVHAILVERGITQMTFEDEMDAVEQEIVDMPTTPGLLLPGQDPAADPNAPPADPAKPKPGDPAKPAKPAAAPAK